MPMYEFLVLDVEGVWGKIRCEAEDAEQARAACRKQLTENEVEPRGSLMPNFLLTLENSYGGYDEAHR